MFKPLFTVATLLLLVATPGECDSKEILAKVGSSTAALEELGKLTVAEKVAHYQSLTDVVTSLGAGIGLGDNCLAHYIYMTGPTGKSKAANPKFTTAAIAPTNWSEPVIAGLIAVAKSDVYALKQMVETASTTLTGIKKLEEMNKSVEEAAKKALAKPATATTSGETILAGADEDATTEEKTSLPVLIDSQKAALTKMTKDIGDTLKAHVQHAMGTLAPVEEVIYALAQGNTATSGGFVTITDASAKAAVTRLNMQAAQLSKDTSSMISGYFAVLRTVGVIDGTGLTGLTELTTDGQVKANFGKRTALSTDTQTKDYYTKANDYQKSFVAYVGGAVAGKANLEHLKILKAVNGVIAGVKATGTSSDSADGGSDALTVLATTLETDRKAYFTATKESFDDNATASSVKICGRKATTNPADLIPGIATT